MAKNATGSTAPPTEPEGPCIRILQCLVCRTMEVLPDFPKGQPAEHDVTLNNALIPHEAYSENPTHVGALLRVDQRLWGNPALRKQMVKQMWEKTLREDKGFVPEYYDAKDNFQHDAIRCFQGHLSPDGACPDWRADNKKIRNPAADDRKALARSVRRDVQDFGPGPTVWICDFCPVRAFYERKANEAKGI